MQARLRVASWSLFACASLAAQNSYQFVPNLVYGVAPDLQGNPVTLRLDLYLPTGVSGPTPCIVWIHGGGWLSGSRFPTPAAGFANHGYAVASVSYRLSGQNKWPAQLNDCRGAVRWLRANAATYNLDPDRFGAFGPSAGGHLSNMLGVTGGLRQTRVGQLLVDFEGAVGGNLGQSSEVQGVVDWFGPTDLLRLSQFPGNLDHDAPNSPESQLIGQLLQTNPEAADSVSPVTWLWAGAPPTRIVHGTSDPVIPYEQSHSYWLRATRAYGLDYTLEALPFASHGGPMFDVDDARAWFDVRLADRPARVGVQASGAVTEGGSGAFTVSRTGPTAAALDVSMAWRGDARVGADVACLPGVVRIPAGSAAVTVPVQALDDALLEPSEALVARVRHSDDYLVVAAATEATLEVLDDDPVGSAPTVGLVALDRTMSEPGPDPAVLRVTRSGATALPLSVDLRVRGVARPGVDHDLTSGEVVIPAGAASVDVVVAVVDDQDAEPTELWVVEVQQSAAYVVGAQRVASGRVFDDDRLGQSLVCVAAEQQRVGEQGGAVDLLVTRTQPQGALTVALGVAGAAVPGSDYAISATSVTFAPNQPEVRVTLTGLDDALLEGDEDVVVSALPGAGYMLGVQASQRILVVDDEASLPAQPVATLGCDELAIGETACLTLVGAPGALHLIGLSFGPGYLPIAPYPLLIDPLGAVTFGLGVVPAGGVAVVPLPVPEAPGLAGSRAWTQSALVGAGVTFSTRLVREFVSAAPR